MATKRSKLRSNQLTFVDASDQEHLVLDLEKQDIIIKFPFVDIRAYGAIGDGVTDDTPAFQSALTEIGTKEVTLLIPIPIYINTDITIPENVCLKFTKGGKLVVNLLTVTNEDVGTGDGTTTTFTLANTPVLEDSETIYIDGVVQNRGTDYTIDYDTGVVTFTTAPANGSTITADYQKQYVLTINGSVEAGLWHIFDGLGRVVGDPKVECVYPEWFGAKADGISDDTVAIQKAINLGKVCKFSAGEYLITSEIYVDSPNKVLTGIGRYSVIKAGFGGNTTIEPAQYVMIYAPYGGITIENITLDGQGNNIHGILLAPKFGSGLSKPFNQRVQNVSIRFLGSNSVALLLTDYDPNVGGTSTLSADGFIQETYISFADVGIFSREPSWTIVGGTIGNCGVGIKVGANSRWVINGSVFTQNGIDIELSGNGITLEAYGAYFEASSQYNVYVNTYATDLQSLVFVGCRFANQITGTPCIDLTNINTSTSLTIVGCQFTGTSTDVAVSRACVLFDGGNNEGMTLVTPVVYTNNRTTTVKIWNAPLDIGLSSNYGVVYSVKDEKALSLFSMIPYFIKIDVAGVDTTNTEQIDVELTFYFSDYTSYSQVISFTSDGSWIGDLQQLYGFYKDNTQVVNVALRARTNLASTTATASFYFLASVVR